MNTVGQILKSKGSKVFTIAKDALVSDALQVFVSNRIGSVLVTEDERVLGIFTERDYAHKIGFHGLNPHEVKVDQVMTSNLITVSPNQSVNLCMELMTKHHIRHLPVFEDGKLVGLLSIGDVVKDMIEELQFMVGQLENYIKGLR